MLVRCFVTLVVVLLSVFGLDVIVVEVSICICIVIAGVVAGVVVDGLFCVKHAPVSATS